MPSPFPGMDPFIEVCGLWEDFHPKLIGEIERTLAVALPDRYFVRLGERSYIVLTDAEGKDFKPFLPDVGVTASAQALAKGDTAAVAEALDVEAVSMEAFIATEFRETFIEIHESAPDNRLVTCLEVLSPANKRRGSEGWKLYVRKRNALLLGTANFVELDLLRAGQRMPMITPWPDSPCTMLVSWEQHAPHCKVWPAHFQRPLKPIPVPLAPPDHDIQLDLQPLLDAIYSRSRFDRRLDYTQPLQPALAEAEANWLAEQLRNRS